MTAEPHPLEDDRSTGLHWSACALQLAKPGRRPHEPQSQGWRDCSPGYLAPSAPWSRSNEVVSETRKRTNLSNPHNDQLPEGKERQGRPSAV